MRFVWHFVLLVGVANCSDCDTAALRQCMRTALDCSVGEFYNVSAGECAPMPTNEVIEALQAEVAALKTQLTTSSNSSFSDSVIGQCIINFPYGSREPADLSGTCECSQNTKYMVLSTLSGSVRCQAFNFNSANTWQGKMAVETRWPEANIGGACVWLCMK